VVNGAIMSLSYDVLNDFAPVALLDAAAGHRREEIARCAKPQGVDRLAQEQSGQAMQGHASVGSTAHIGGIFFQKQTDTRFAFVPYRGGGPAMQDLIAGRST
jgi:tripartite-type tricarboxylate transporter receptor subunit TctC